MPVIRSPFGQLRDGRTVERIMLSHPQSRFAVEVLEYGATLRSIFVPVKSGRSVNTVLSYPSLREYVLGNVYLGATIGRCAGRTAAGARAMLRLTRNEGSNHLHGGTTGFSRSLWQVVDIDDGSTPKVRLRHRSPTGEDGYPGNLVVDAEFSLVDAFVLRVIMEARTDVATPLNMTLHPYFNLSGDPASTIDDHQLRIDSGCILPLCPARLPTGEMMSVDQTPFDFRVSRPIGASRYNGHAQLQISGGYDHYYVLNEGARLAADVYSPRSSLGLRVWTNQKGLQFYSGNQLDEAAPIAFPARSGFCLEPHAFPNAVNEPRFPDVTLRAGDAYHYETSYEFYTRPAGRRSDG